MNLKVRIKNPVFWLEIACSIIFPALAGIGMKWNDVTSWNTLIEALNNAILNPVILASVFSSVLAALNDPTTKGFKDSSTALTYQNPKED
ncbi:MAG: phage holin [Oscillospiraceae bacterium]|nr:phage holin [Oscillospiraceae bacterium]